MEEPLHLWEKHLTHPLLKDEAKKFVGVSFSHHGETSGPHLGNLIESKFRERLETYGYDVPVKGKADLGSLHVDIKSMQFKGKRGGAAKLHGYSSDENPPDYSLLVFCYEYDSEHLHITHALFIPANLIVWVRARHYLCSMPDDALLRYTL